MQLTKQKLLISKDIVNILKNTEYETENSVYYISAAIDVMAYDTRQCEIQCTKELIATIIDILHCHLKLRTNSYNYFVLVLPDLSLKDLKLLKFALT